MRKPALSNTENTSAPVLASDRDRRRRRRHATHAGRRTRHAERVAGLDLHAIDVGVPATIRHVVQRLAIGRVLRIDVLRVRLGRRARESAPLATSIVASAKLAQNRSRSKSEPAPAESGPAARSVANASVRPSGDQAGCRSANRSFVSWRIAPVARSNRYRSLRPALHSRERELLAVGRPRDRRDRADVLRLDAARRSCASARRDVDLVVAVRVRHERELLRVRRPAARRIEKARARRSASRRRARELRLHLARHRIGEVQVDAREVARREERDEPTIRAHRRRHVVLAVLARSEHEPDRPSPPDACGPATSGAYCCRIAARQRFDSESDVMPSTLRIGVVEARPRATRGRGAAPSRRPTCRRCTPTAPRRSGTGSTCRRSVSCLIVGRSLRSTASRSHIAVCASSPPNDRYSAIPSTSQSGSRSSDAPPRAFDCAMSYWNTCTIS